MPHHMGAAVASPSEKRALRGLPCNTPLTKKEKENEVHVQDLLMHLQSALTLVEQHDLSIYRPLLRPTWRRLEKAMQGTLYGGDAEEEAVDPAAEHVTVVEEVFDFDVADAAEEEVAQGHEAQEPKTSPKLEPKADEPAVVHREEPVEDEEEAKESARVDKPKATTRKRKPRVSVHPGVTARGVPLPDDVRGLWKKGRLADLTVSRLQTYLRIQRLPVTGTKQILLARVIAKLEEEEEILENEGRAEDAEEEGQESEQEESEEEEVHEDDDAKDDGEEPEDPVEDPCRAAALVSTRVEMEMLAEEVVLKAPEPQQGKGSEAAKRGKVMKASRGMQEEDVADVLRCPTPTLKKEKEKEKEISKTNEEQERKKEHDRSQEAKGKRHEGRKEEGKGKRHDKAPELCEEPQGLVGFDSSLLEVVSVTPGRKVAKWRKGLRPGPSPRVSIHSRPSTEIPLDMYPKTPVP